MAWLSGFNRSLLRAYHRVRPYLSYARSFLRSRHQIIRVWPVGEIELDGSVALFIHFNVQGEVADYVLTYLRALKDSGFDVVFVSNSRLRRRGSLEALQPLCRAVIERHNVGYDFGAVREALNLLRLPRPETQRLLIANDSVYGPLVRLQDVLARVDFDAADLWGATDSWQHRYHLQSYFLLAGRTVLTSPVWRSFWQRVRQVSSKEWVIARYEIGLTQRLLRAGLRCRPLWPYYELIDQTDVVQTVKQDDDAVAFADPLNQMRIEAIRRVRDATAHRIPLNPTSDLWRQLLLAGYPFLKIGLLRDNPTNVPDVADWRTAIAGFPEADLAMIERDLQRRMRNRVP